MYNNKYIFHNKRTNKPSEQEGNNSTNYIYQDSSNDNIKVDSGKPISENEGTRLIQLLL